ncbi:MAG: radical SAM protein, partial [Candidatus Bathyarchaeota archaeon]|nr:radical SAM protein [Candidatus Bathyarchaeota archaeon]MDI6806090.1 radical SAM protein [Candidatus Bathyarchaeia archaeon]
MEKKLFEISSTIPLVGCIAFGLIDRGTNIIQVRPISTCPLSCIFCSTNAGPKSKIRQTEYIVPLEYLTEEFEKIVAFKGRRRIEAHIDTVGDPITYPKIVELVSALNQISGVETISMQTHGSTLNAKLLDDLSDAGLKRINLSLDAVDSTLAKKLADTEWYEVERVIELMHHIISNTKIDLLVAPVWIPRINDTEIPKIISLTKDICKTKSPLLGIQKYEIHKHGRKVKEAKLISWKVFYEQLRVWEKELKAKLVLSPKDFGIHKRVMLPIPYRKYETIRVRVVGPGWLKREKLAVTEKG